MIGWKLLTWPSLARDCGTPQKKLPLAPTSFYLFAWPLLCHLFINIRLKIEASRALHFCTPDCGFFLHQGLWSPRSPHHNSLGSTYNRQSRLSYLLAQIGNNQVPSGLDMNMCHRFWKYTVSSFCCPRNAQNLPHCSLRRTNGNLACCTYIHAWDMCGVERLRCLTTSLPIHLPTGRLHTTLLQCCSNDSHLLWSLARV